MSKKQPDKKTKVVEKDIDQSTQNVTINMLNPDCLVNIFVYLPVKDRIDLGKVCRKWKDANKLAWLDTKTLNFSYHDNYYNSINSQSNEDIPRQSVVRTVLNCCGRYLTSLTLDAGYDSRIMSAVIKYCSHLTKLTVAFKYYNMKNFIEPFSRMENLQCIQILDYATNARTKEYDTSILESLPASIEEISFSSLSRSYRLSPSPNFEAVFTQWRVLVSLELSSWKLEKGILEIITRNTTLTHLSLAESKLDEQQQSLISNFINLKYLDLSNVRSVDDQLIMSIIKNCAHLKHLNIAYCAKLSEMSLDKLKYLNCLEHLNTAGLLSITDAIIIGIKNNCKQLKHLDLSDCNVSSFALSQLGNSKNLTELILNNTDIDDNVLGKFDNLEILECSHSPGVTDVGIMKILKTCPNLTRLNASQTPITVESVKYACNVAECREKKVKLHFIVDKRVANDYDGEIKISSSFVVELDDSDDSTTTSSDTSFSTDDEEF